MTGHDADGKAVVVLDAPAGNVKVRKAAAGLVSTLIWATDETPADLSRSEDRAARETGVAPPPMGSIFRVVEFPPLAEGAAGVDSAALLKEMGLTEPAHGSARSPFMHRTRSVDYAVVISGEIDMLLDDSEVRLKAGDVVVQQGTHHAWMNRSRAPCRVAFVLIDAREPAAWQSAGDHSPGAHQGT